MIQKQTKISDLVLSFEGELRKYGYSEDSLRRYRKVFRELIEFSDDSFYSQKVCTDFLVDRLERAGGFFEAGESSKTKCTTYVRFALLQTTLTSEPSFAEKTLGNLSSGQSLTENQLRIIWRTLYQGILLGAISGKMNMFLKTSLFTLTLALFQLLQILLRTIYRDL